MPESRYRMPPLLVAMLLLAIQLAAMQPGTALEAAEYSQSQLQQQIDLFKHGESQRFAPQTVNRAEAYMGAAMLADEQHKQQEHDAALAKAAETIQEARRTASDFRQRFSRLLALNRDADVVNTILASSGRASRNSSAVDRVEAADSELALAIKTHEQGELNQTATYAGKALEAYRQALEGMIPSLARLTASVIGKAANANARQYAPHIYQAAKDKLAELEAFKNGKRGEIPPHPERGLYLARESIHVAEQVKAWRRKRGSHEQLLLKTRQMKLDLAHALGMASHGDAMLTDIPARDLLKAANKLTRELAEERKAHRQELSRMKKEYQQQLQSNLAAQTDAMKQAQQHQVSNIKEAFKAKLERETFEQKRQQRLRKLFKPGEVNILVNLDGSLLIRLVSLKFKSGRSRIDPKHYDMLGRLKEAMDIYQDRNLRIEGHTDNQGGVKSNQILSLKRAEAVRDFLIAAGADGTRLKALGYGEVRPIASNEFARGRAMNRRIDVVINAAK